ncbi:hypothetical protein D0Z00_000662 [Geotrichum galactomycetum]|uniref:Uncharacterized protein n=1 Tax=Geotrichum galactomycetum TaxID=27317 RepID=A0ACB6V961_9ASCO|nr:hypothetical protein D0Z00_000662 [Geotrichum candidum]
MQKILTVQSHTIHGYVGNKASTFPLQLAGWDVDAFNTVQLSNHTGYGTTRGIKFSAEQLREQWEGLQHLKLAYTALLTGYVPTPEGVEQVGRVGLDLKQANPRVLWVLDPVLGDDGRYYVSEQVLPVYRQLIASGQVDLVTPNQFEAEALTGLTIKTPEDVALVFAKLHEHMDQAIISSVKYANEPGYIYSYGSAIVDKATRQTRQFYIRYPGLESYFTGTGDLFAALTVDRYYKARVAAEAEEQQSTKDAAEVLALTMTQVLTTVQRVLKRTCANNARAAAAAGDTVRPGRMGDIESMKHSELNIVHCKDLFEAATDSVDLEFQVTYI